MEKIQKILQSVGFFALIVSMLLRFGIESMFVNYPRAPDIVNGRLTPYILKGVTVFTTYSESVTADLLKWAMPGSVVLIAASLLVGYFSTGSSKK